MNLVETIMQTLGGDTLAKLSSVLGAGEDETKSAVGVAVPALLGGIGSMVSKPEGAEKLWAAVEGVDDSVVGNFTDLLGGAQPDVLENMGGGLLDGLFGKGLVATLVTVLGSYLGGKGGMVGKLLPLIAPVIMGMLSKQVKSGGLDLDGLVKLILGQKDNIASAMPAGLSTALENASGLGDFGFATGSDQSSSRPAPPATAASTSSMGWLIPLIAVLAIGGLIWATMKGGNEPVGDVNNSIEDATVDLGVETGDALDVSAGFKDLLANMGNVLDNVEDRETANEALPKLEEMSSILDRLTVGFGELPDAAQGSIVTTIRDALETLQEKKEAVLAIPGVGELLRPVLDALFEKINNLLPA